MTPIRLRQKIVVGTNSLTESQYPAYTNHCQFWFRLGRSYPDIDFIFANPARMSIDRMRNMTAKTALEVGAEYILFLDDDVLVEPNLGLKQLLDCKADIASGKVCVRGYPFDYMAFKNNNSDELRILNKLPKHGIYDCDAVGFSFALLKVSLLKRLQPPYFITGVNHTEDIYYCLKARQVAPKCTIKINCDCECGHILWPEVIHEANREAYKKYFMEINKIKPPVKLDPNKTNKNGRDRGIDYLDLIKGKQNEQATKIERRVRHS
jgi:hypothetical protein